MTDHGIRRATREDASEMARLLSPLGYPVDERDITSRWERWSAEGNWALVVPGPEPLVHGVITLHRMFVLHRPKPVGRITSLAVDASARGRGLGRALIEAAEADLRREGCGLVEVTSHQRRIEAHEFYRHVDFEETSVRFAKVFGDPIEGAVD